MNNYYLDTNQLYYLGKGTVRLADIKDSEAALLFVDPYSLAEVMSGLDDPDPDKFVERQRAIQAIGSIGIQVCPSTTVELVKGFGLDYAAKPHWDDNVDWEKLIELVSRAHDQSELFVTGVPFWGEGELRRLDLRPLQKWRESVDMSWQDEMVQVLRNEVSGFSSWYDTDRSGSQPKLRKSDLSILQSKISDPEWMACQLLCLQERVFLMVDKGKYRPPDSAQVRAIFAAIYKFECFCKIYTAYLIRTLSTGRKPQLNDSGDIELFLHLHDPSHVLVTAENTWCSLASEAGLGGQVKQVKPRPN